jgi:hypothetical protein
LFVECKVLRLVQAAKASAEPIERELKKLAKAIGQLYATVAEALNGSYPHWQPSGKPVYPIVVTLDNWNLLSHTLQGAVRACVEEEFSRRGLDVELLNKYPYAVCWIRELEISIQVMHSIGIATLMEGITKGEKAGYMMDPYIRTEFPTEFSQTVALFPTEPTDMLAYLS